MAHEPDDQPGIAPEGFSDPGLDESELRARRALGLSRADAPRTRSWGGEPARRQGGPGGNGHHKSRFVQDGEVPVVMVSQRPGRTEAAAASGGADRTRLAEAEAALARERAAREQADRALREAHTQIHDLQTRLGHAELARNEAQAAERATLDRLDLLARTAPAQADQPPPDDPFALPPRPRRRRPLPGPDANSTVSRRGADREGSEPAASDQPVKWWLPRGHIDDSDDEGDPA